MVDVLLTHSYHLPYDSKQLRKMQPYPPLGTLYAASALRARGISVAVFDPMLIEPAAQFAKALEMHRPRIVAVYEDDFNFLSKMCLTRMREVAAQIAQSARSVGATTIVHGSDATDNPGLFLANGFLYVLSGESEETLAHLCGALLRSEDIGELDGLVRIGNHGTPVFSARRLASNPGWHTLPAPSRDLVDPIRIGPPGPQRTDISPPTWFPAAVVPFAATGVPSLSLETNSICVTPRMWPARCSL